MSEAAPLGGLAERLDRHEQRDAVRAVVHDYFDRCDELGPESDLEALAQLFTETAVWRGAGNRYAESFGEHRGRAAIIAFLTTYAVPRFFRANIHVLANERLAVTGDEAAGNWLMLQMPSFVSGGDWLMAARIDVALRRVDGVWRIESFTTRNLMAKPVEEGWQSPRPIPVPQGDEA